jgi:hypothetical protein
MVLDRENGFFPGCRFLDTIRRTVQRLLPFDGTPYQPSGMKG